MGQILDDLKKQPKGKSLQKARRKIASFSVGARELESMRTRSIPVSTPFSDEIWRQVRVAAATLRGFGEGSMWDVLSTLHTNGFRIFPSSSECEAFGLKDRYASSGFDPVVKQAFGEAMPNIGIDAFRKVLSVAPRKVAKEIDVEVLADRFAREFGVKKVKGDITIPSVVMKISDRITEQCKTWSSMVDDPVVPARIVDAVLAEEGVKAPSLSILLSAPPQTIPSGFGGVCVRFDESAKVIDAETASGRFAGIVARYLSEVGVEAEGAGKYVQSCVTTTNANGLSWLFGVGRKAILNNREDDVLRVLHATSDRGRDATAKLISAFNRLPDLKLFGDRCFVESRTTVQGAVDSLIANYVARLGELSKAVREMQESGDTCPEIIGAGAPEGLYEGLPFNADDVANIFLEKDMQASMCVKALEVLTGQSSPETVNYDTALKDFAAFQEWTERVFGVLNTLRARLVARGKEEGASSEIAPFVFPKWARGFDRVVSINLQEGAADDVLPKLVDEYQQLRKERDAFVEKLFKRNSELIVALPRAIEDRINNDFLMMKELGISGRRSTESKKARANRFALDSIGRAIRRSNPELWKWAVDFLAAKSLSNDMKFGDRGINGYFLSGKGDIYLPSVSKKTYEVPLNSNALEGFDVMAFAESARTEAEAKGYLKDAVAIESAILSLKLLCLPHDVSVESFDSSQPNELSWINLRPSNGTIKRSDAIKLVNSEFTSRISGALYRLNRKHFVERFDLRCFMGSTVLVVPTARVWSPPVQYRHGTMSWPIESLAIKIDGGIDVVATAKAVVRFVQDNPESEHLAGCMALLRQLPHKWAVMVDFEKAEAIEGFVVDGGKLQGGWVKRKGYFLAPPAHFAGELSELFTCNSASPHGLMFERECEWDGSKVKEIGRKVTANIPLSTTTIKDAPTWIPLHLMGIDLGEAGIGVTLKHIRSGTESADFIPIKRVRKLVRSVDHYRRRVQPRQGFRAKFSDSLAFAADAAVGEICSVIDALIARYQAIPVFETQAAKVQGSLPMVGKVYEGVMSRYCFMQSPATAEGLRKTHWFGAARFEVRDTFEMKPDVRKEEGQEGRVSKSSFRPMTVAPGLMISGYRTSEECSCCKRNFFVLFDAARQQGQASVEIDSNGFGTLRVDGKDLRFCISAPTKNPGTIRRARQRNMRAPMELIVDSQFSLVGEANRKAFLRLCRHSIRRAQPSIQSRRGWGAVFVCPFSECEARLDGDVNASTNLVRRVSTRMEAEMGLYNNLQAG